MTHGSNIFVDTAEEYLDPLYKLEDMCKVRQEVAGMFVQNHVSRPCPHGTGYTLSQYQIE